MIIFVPMKLRLSSHRRFKTDHILMVISCYLNSARLFSWEFVLRNFEITLLTSVLQSRNTTHTNFLCFPMSRVFFYSGHTVKILLVKLRKMKWEYKEKGWRWKLIWYLSVNSSEWVFIFPQVCRQWQLLSVVTPGLWKMWRKD